jgi:hypothetical protein
VRITRIVPGNHNNTITVSGDNFGKKDNAGVDVTTITNRGIVFVDKDQIIPQDIEEWKDNKIVFKLPNILKFEPGKYITIITEEGLKVTKKYCGGVILNKEPTPTSNVNEKRISKNKN